ncbi:MAG: acyltransferase [Planctomycetes bacterium]|nr:acyltransferase [Planctomycetota bacterium]
MSASPGGAAPRSALRKDHVPELDGLRGIAVLLVLWQHVPAMVIPYAVFGVQRAVIGEFQGGEWPIWFDGLRDAFVQAGYLGVDTFFVLSGFLITRILRAERATGAPLRHFLLRRVLRIFPIYYLTLAVVWIVHPGSELPWCAAYLSNFRFAFHDHGGGWLSHTWSLAIEEHFYLLWPLCVYGCADRTAFRIAAYGIVPFALLAAVASAWHWRSDAPFVEYLLQVGTPYRALSLALGALLAFGEPLLRAAPRRTAWYGALGVVSGYALHLVPALLDRGSPPTTTLAVLRLCGFATTASGLVAAGIACSGGAALWARALRSRSLRYVGRISYGLYLYHYVVYHGSGIYALDAAKPSTALHVAGAIAASFCIAALSFAVLERPILNYAARFRARRVVTSPPPAA